MRNMDVRSFSEGCASMLRAELSVGRNLTRIAQEILSQARQLVTSHSKHDPKTITLEPAPSENTDVMVKPGN